MKNCTVGVDIAKYSFDAAFKTQKLSLKHKNFSNNLQGFKEFLAWIGQHHNGQLHVVMEATGRYSLDLATFLYEQKHLVSVVNPARISFFAKSRLSRVKTDKVDAALIADYACAENQELRLWQPDSSTMQNFKALVQTCEYYKKLETQLALHLQESSNSVVQEVLQQSLAEIKKQRLVLEDHVKKLIQNSSDLKKSVMLMMTIPGIGQISSWKLAAYLPPIENFGTAKQLAVYAGLTPAVRQSGISVYGKGHLSKIGNSLLREALYMPALSLMRKDSVFATFIGRLQAKNKNGKVIVCALMHKLMRIIFALLKHEVAFSKTVLEEGSVTVSS